MSRQNRTIDPDRSSIIKWVNVVALLVGIWILAPMITTLISVFSSGSVRLAISPPDELDAPAGVDIRALASDVPVDQLGSGARTALIGGTVIQLLTILVMLVAVTVAMRSVRPGHELSNRTKVVAIVVVFLAGFVGLIGTHVVTSAGVLACSDLYEACSAGRTWDDPLTMAFPLAGIGLGLVFALVRSETVARRNAEGLV